MYYLYYLQSLDTPKYYIGITSNMRLRMNSHRHAARTGKKSPLYSAMRKYDFYMVQMGEYHSFEEVAEAEKSAISFARQLGKPILNLADGGDGCYVVPEHLKDAWRAKLSIARKGRKPALGMKHTDETKKLCGEYGKLRWDIHGRYPEEVITYSFKEAKEKFSISKTHYYRLLKRAKSNDLS